MFVKTIIENIESARDNYVVLINIIIRIIIIISVFHYRIFKEINFFLNEKTKKEITITIKVEISKKNREDFVFLKVDFSVLKIF